MPPTLALPNAAPALDLPRRSVALPPWARFRPAGVNLLGRELALLVGVMLVAFVLRARLLSDVPRYTDEVNEIQAAIDIARGRSLPTVSGTKHVGAFFDYLLAAAILAFGRSPDLPRQVVLAAGLATVLLTYGYARSLGGRYAGLLAAGWLAVSAPHVLLSSRVAWSASLTPLFMVGVAWALDCAVSRRQPHATLLAGLLAGLALQAHPSVAALLPGLGVFVLLRGRHLLCRPDLYAAGLLFIAACANIVIYNWQSRFGAIRSISQEYPDKIIGPAAYLENLGAPLRGLALTLASAVDATREVSASEPSVLLAAGICLLGLIHLARRGSPLPLLVMLFAVALLPLVHDDFDPILKARYIMPLVPLTYVAVGVLGADLLARGGSAGGARWRGLAAGGVWLVLAGGMLAALLRFEAVALANGCTNAPQRALVAEAERHRSPGESVLLDEGVVRPAERLGYLGLLEWSRARVSEASLRRGGVWAELAERPSFLTAVDDGKAVALFERQGLPLLPPAIVPVHPARRDPRPSRKKGDGGIGLYRVSAQGALLLAYDPHPGCGSLRLN